MRILITGGHTQVQIDRVRAITNIFHGRTAIAVTHAARGRSHDVVVLGNKTMETPALDTGATFVRYETFDDLEAAMAREIRFGQYDAVVHSAAVSDYAVSRVLGADMQPLDSSGKVGSNHDRLYLELARTKKLVDEIRGPWGFRGILVKFKLQVGMSDMELIDIAEMSRVHSGADIMVANCLEWSRERAYVIRPESTLNVTRDRLPLALIEAIEEVGVDSR